MNLHEFFTLLVLPIGTSRDNKIQYMKYISEYILKLQIHQHSLLTWKVFSRHNSSSQVFVTESSSPDHHQSWIITGSSSSLLPLSRSNGAISQFYSPQEVLQSHPFFMLVVGLASMYVFILFSTYILHS